MRLLQAIAVGAACTFGLSLSAVAQETVELKFGVQTPEFVHYNKDLFIPWAKQVVADSEGTLDIKFFFGGTLGKEGELLESLEVGAADIVLDLAAYYPGRFPLSDLTALPLVVDRADTSSTALWKVYSDGLLGKGFEGLKVLALSTPPAAVLMMKDKAVTNPTELNGMKISGGGAIKGEILSAFGAAPISTTVGELYQSLDRGVVSGAISYYTAIPPFKLQEVTDYYTNIPLGGSLMLVLMSQAKYDSLPNKAKAAIDKNSGQPFSDDFGKLWAKQNEIGKKMAIDANGTVQDPSAEELAAWKAGLQPIVDDWIAEHEGAKELFDAFVAARDSAAM